MRTIILLFLALVIAIMTTACLTDPPPGRKVETPAQAPQMPDNVKVLLVTGEYPPYTSEKLPHGGFFTQIVSAVLKDMGVEYEIRFYPWHRCEEMIQNGQAWASFPYANTTQKASKYLLSAPVLSARHKYFYLKDNQKIAQKEGEPKALPDFKDCVFGGANGYWYGSKADLTALGLTKVQWAEDPYGLVRMLYNGRIEVFAEDELVGRDVIHRLYQGEEDKFATLSNNAITWEYLLIVSKDYPRSEELLIKFNDSLKKLKENGRLNEIAKAKDL